MTPHAALDPDSPVELQALPNSSPSSVRMTLGSFLSSVSPVGEKRGGGVDIGDKPESSCVKTYVSFRVSHRAWNKQHLDVSHQPAAPEMGLLMDSSSTKQRCSLFYGLKMTGHSWGKSLGMCPQAWKTCSPPRASAPSWPTSRAVRSRAAWNLSVRVTGVQRQKPRSRSSSEEWEPGILQYSQWAGVDSRGWQIGQEWQAGQWRKKRGLLTAWKYAVFPR